VIPKYRTQLSLRLDGGPAPVERVRTVVAKWLGSRHGLSESDVRDSGTIEVSPGVQAEVMYEIVDEQEQWALQLTREDAKEPMHWVVDVGVAHDSKSTTVSIGMGVEAQAQRALTVKRRLRPPGVVAALIAEFDALAGQPLQIRPQEVDVENFDDFYSWLISADRVLPLVAVSVDPFSEDPLLNSVALQNLTIGIAEVAVLTKRAAFRLTESFESLLGGREEARQWAVYNGGVRVFWAGLDVTSEEASPYQHARWIPNLRRLPAHSDDAVFEQVSWAAVHRTYEDWLDVGTLRAAHDQEVLHQRAEALGEEEQQRYRQALSRKDRRIDALLRQIREEVRQSRETRDALEQSWAANRELKEEVARLQRRVADAEENAASETFPSVRSAVERAKAAFSSTLVFASNMSIDSAETGDYWMRVLGALSQLCEMEQTGKLPRGHEDIGVELPSLLQDQGLPGRRPSHKDTDVFRSDPDSGESIHLRWRLHMRSGALGETESIYWEPIGKDRESRRLLVGHIGHHL